MAGPAPGNSPAVLAFPTRCGSPLLRAVGRPVPREARPKKRMTRHPLQAMSNARTCFENKCEAVGRETPEDVAILATALAGPIARMRSEAVTCGAKGMSALVQGLRRGSGREAIGFGKLARGTSEGGHDGAQRVRGDEDR
jgi:hypothetical protein